MGAFEVLEGCYLKEPDRYVAMVRAKRSRKTLLVGSGIEPVEVEFPKAAASLRFALALARHVMNN